MNRAVLRYARWQLWDHLKGSGRIIGLAAVVIGLLLWRLRVNNPDAVQGAEAAMTGFLGSLSWPLILLATSGIISTDRVEGFNRALFSAPVSPMWYYLQRWLIGGVVIGTLPLLLSVSVQLAMGTWVDPWPFTAVHLLLYLLLGGLVFCWSSFGRRDWAIALSLYLGQGAIHTAQVQGFPLPRIFFQVNQLLPPFHLVDFGVPTNHGVTLPSGMEWLHFVGYGVGLMVVGLLVLRFRPMGSGARG
ncbi:MAG: hypothetical protein SGI84_00585 [Gemmatimonadota bacterium]|nr:hypothetical protein [Gemmatimonadota bacterium]